MLYSKKSSKGIQVLSPYTRRGRWGLWMPFLPISFLLTRRQTLPWLVCHVVTVPRAIDSHCPSAWSPEMSSVPLQVMSACPGKYVCYSRQCLQSPSSPREVCSQQLHQPTPCPLLLAPHTSKEGTLKPPDLSTQASADTETSNRKRSLVGLQRTGGGVRQAARMGFF